METKQNIITEDEYGIRLPTIGVKIDPDRVSRIFENMGRAIYYHHFKRKWSFNVFVRPEFLLFFDPINSQDLNKNLESLSNEFDRFFKTKKYFGENLNIFKYQIFEADLRTAIMRLNFYGDSRVTIFFTDKEINAKS